GLDQPCRLILKECLVRGHFSSLGRDIPVPKVLETLPPQPAEFVVVPHGDKRKMCTRILYFGVVQICLIDRTVIVHRGRDMKIFVLFTARITDQVSYLSGVVLLAVLGVPNQLVNEVAKVKDKAQLFRLRSAFVLINHSSVRVLRTEVCILTAYERKTNWPR